MTPLSNLLHEEYLAKHLFDDFDAQEGEKQFCVKFHLLRPQFVDAAVEPAAKDAKQRNKKKRRSGAITVEGLHFTTGVPVRTGGHDGSGGKQRVEGREERWALKRLIDYPLVKVVQLIPEEI